MIAAKNQETLSESAMTFVRASPGMTVDEAVRLMARADAEVAVVEVANELHGIFSARDFIKRVIGEGKDPSRIEIKDVMTREVFALPDTATCHEAEKLMDKANFHYVPVKNSQGKTVGMISALDLLKRRVQELDRETEVLSAYAAVEGIGGD